MPEVVRRSESRCILRDAFLFTFAISAFSSSLYHNFMKTDVKNLLDSTDVQDPTDFPPSSTAPGLRALDSALRCNICQELYEAPVVLTCGHCFCSLVRVMVTVSAQLYHWSSFLQCARNQLNAKPTCPTCWKETTVSTFRVNPAMEEAVTAWKEARHVPRHCVITTDKSIEV